MSNVRKTLQMTSLLFGMAILFCYIAWHLGYEGFIIVGHIAIPNTINWILGYLLLLIDLSLRGGFVLQEYSWKILKWSVPLVIIDALSNVIWPHNILTSGFLPMIVYFLGSIKVYKVSHKIKDLFREPLISISILLRQFIVSQITQTPLTSDVSVYTALRFSIDGIIFMLLFYTIGGLKHYERQLEQLVFPGFLRANKEDSSAFSQSVDGIPLNTFEKWMMRSVIAVAQVIQWMFILWVCSLDNLFLDALVMTTSFICHGMIISKRQHLKPIILCTLAATAMFYFAARFTISFQYSQFFPIVIGLLLVYTMYRISYHFDQVIKEKAQKNLERIELLERQLDQAWNQLDDLS